MTAHSEPSANAESTSTDSLDPGLLEILACPTSDHAAVREVRDDEGHAVICTQCGRRFPVRDGIPVMLLSEATGGPGAGQDAGPAPDSGAVTGE